MLKNSYFSEVSKGAFPISYYFMMGSHGNGDLTTIGNDLNLMNAYETTEEKSEVAWEKTFENYKQLGISGTVNLWYRKLVSTFSDGYSNITTRVDAGQTESSMYEWFAGNRKGLFQLYAQSVSPYYDFRRMYCGAAQYPIFSHAGVSFDFVYHSVGAACCFICMGGEKHILRAVSTLFVSGYTRWFVEI